MDQLSALKPFWPLALSFLLPKVLSYLNTAKASVQTRPPPRPLPKKTSIGLNILFLATCFFLFLTFRDPEPNIFKLTSLRLYASTEVLFNRLASLGRGPAFDAQMMLLKNKFTTKKMRHLYLRFGPTTVLNCDFCNLDDDTSYILYHLPTNVLLPHLLSILTLGLATSSSLSGFEAHRWRHTAITTSLILFLTDLYITATQELHIDGHMPGPAGTFWLLRVTRHLVLCAAQAMTAGLIYFSATNRLPVLVSAAESDPRAVQRRRGEMLAQTALSLQIAQTKLHAVNVAKNAVNRDAELKGADDAYWRRVTDIEGTDPVNRIWRDDDVQAAVARSLGEGSFDMERCGRDCETFVTNTTRGLDEN